MGSTERRCAKVSIDLCRPLAASCHYISYQDIRRDYSYLAVAPCEMRSLKTRVFFLRGCLCVPEICPSTHPSWPARASKRVAFAAV